MTQKRRQRGRGDAGNTAGRPQRSRARSTKFFAHLVRQPADFLVIQLVRQGKGFVLAERGDIRLLAVEISGIERIMRDLLQDRRIDRRRFGPHPGHSLYPRIGSTSGIRQQFKRRARHPILRDFYIMVDKFPGGYGKRGQCSTCNIECGHLPPESCFPHRPDTAERNARPRQALICIVGAQCQAILGT